MDKLTEMAAVEERRVVRESLSRTLSAKAETIEREEDAIRELEAMLATARSQVELLKEVQDRVGALLGKGKVTFDDRCKIVHALGVRVKVGPPTLP